MKHFDAWQRRRSGEDRPNRDRVLHWAISTSVGRLVFAALAAYLAAAAFATSVYRLLDEFSRKSKADLAFYSIVTQSTVGYGDLVPTSPVGRLVAAVQILFGLCFMAAVPAVVLLRVFSPGVRGIAFSPKAIFDPAVGQFRFRFVNDSMLSVQIADASLRIPVYLAPKESPKSWRTQHFRVRLEDSELPPPKSHIPILVRTAPINSSQEETPLEFGTTEVFAGPGVLGPKRSLRLTLALTYPIGGQQTTEQTYGLKDVLCGVYKDLSITKKGMKNARRDWRTFDDIEEWPTSERCGTCAFVETCSFTNKVA